MHIPFCSFSNMLTPHELLSTYNSEVSEDHFMTPCRMTPMDTLCTSCKSRGIVILYMLVWCYGRGLLHPCQPRGGWNSYEMTWWYQYHALLLISAYQIDWSCLYHWRRLLQWHIIYIHLVVGPTPWSFVGEENSCYLSLVLMMF